MAKNKEGDQDDDHERNRKSRPSFYYSSNTSVDGGDHDHGWSITLALYYRLLIVATREVSKLHTSSNRKYVNEKTK